MVKNLLKVIHVLEGLQQAEHLRMLNAYGLQSTKIGNWQCENWKLIWGFWKLLCEILTQDLGMKHVVAKIVLQRRLPEQKEHRTAVRRTVWGPKVPTLVGTEASLSYVQCSLYLVSSSVSVSVFHSTWMGTFWTYLERKKQKQKTTDNYSLRR